MLVHYSRNLADAGSLGSAISDIPHSQCKFRLCVTQPEDATFLCSLHDSCNATVLTVRVFFLNQVTANNPRTLLFTCHFQIFLQQVGDNRRVLSLNVCRHDLLVDGNAFLISL